MLHVRIEGNSEVPWKFRGDEAMGEVKTDKWRKTPKCVSPARGTEGGVEGTQQGRDAPGTRGLRDSGLKADEARRAWMK